jgi:hypothetical protein
MSDITFEQLVDAILEGVADDNVDALSAAIISRREIKNSKKILFISPGDTVKFNAQASPKYLRGHTATVTKVNKTTVTVDIPEDAWGARKYCGAKNIRTPISIVDKVTV